MDMALSSALSPSPGASALPTNMSARIHGFIPCPTHLSLATRMDGLMGTPLKPINTLTILMTDQDSPASRHPVGQRMDWSRQQRQQRRHNILITQ